MFLLFREILRDTIISVLGASLLVGTVIASATNPIQSIYWQSGMTENLVPLILSTFLIWLFLQRAIHPTLTLTLCFIISLLAGTVSNAFVVGQIVLLGLFALALRNRSRLNQRLFISLVAAVLALAVIWFSAGTQARVQTEATNSLIATTPSVVSRLGAGLVRGFKDPLSYTLKNTPLAWAAVLILPFIVAQLNPATAVTSNLTAELVADSRKRVFAVAAALGLPAAAMIACMLMWAAGYVAEGKLPSRTWITGQFFVLAASVPAAYILGFVFAAVFPSSLPLLHRYSGAIVATLLIATAINVAVNGTQIVGILDAYSPMADQRDAQLRSGVLAVAELPSFGLNDLGVPWFDQCLQNYYHLPALPVVAG